MQLWELVEQSMQTSNSEGKFNAIREAGALFKGAICLHSWPRP